MHIENTEIGARMKKLWLFEFELDFWSLVRTLGVYEAHAGRKLLRVTWTSSSTLGVHGDYAGCTHADPKP